MRDVSRYVILMKELFSRILFIAIFFTAFSLAVNAQDVVYAGEERKAYHIELLTLALSYFPEKKYNIRAFGHDIPKQRAFILMANNDGIDVIIGTSTAEREKLYQPIRFPILRGLNGWRVALVKKNNVDLFENVTTEKAFKKLIPGQFHSWTDTQILEENGIKVAKGSDHDGLYKMLSKGRIDYFPRSILEAELDRDRNKALNLVIDPHILIKYPNAYYFYVSKDNHQLAEDLSRGLELALADGRFEKLFMKTYGDVLKRLQVNKRRVFNLKNSLLLESTPVERAELWVNLPAKNHVH